MNIEIILLNEKHTDTLIGQTKTRPQQTVEFKMIKQVQTFSINSPIILHEEGKRLLAVTSYEATIFLTQQMKTLVFQLLNQVIGLPEVVQKLFTNCKKF